MKLLQNKSTREIGCLVCSFGKTPEKITVVEYIDGRRGSKVWYYNSLAELNEEWEDYKEPKTHWMIDTSVLEPVREIAGMPYEIDKEIGNWFDTKEEAERAVEKLKAWKRLKDKGFRPKMWEWEYIYDDNISGELIIKAHIDDATDSDGKYTKDLDICFGGEE